MMGDARSIAVEKAAASAIARRKAWKTRSSARSRRPAPSDRATADETPAPMPLLVVCSTSITHGKASDAPASASVPIRPRKNPSKVITPTKAKRLRTFGAASRSSVGRIGPSSRSLVRAAGDGGDILADAGEPERADALCWVMGAGPERDRSGARERPEAAPEPILGPAERV